MNNLVSELYFLQLSRSEKVQKQTPALKAVKEEIKSLQNSNSLRDTELASLRKQLRDQKDEAEKNEAFWKQTNEELVANINKKTLEYADLRLAKDILEQATKELEEQTTNYMSSNQRSYTKGTVNFFKKFMHTLSDFDRSPFGETTVVYAAKVKAQLEEENKASDGGDDAKPIKEYAKVETSEARIELEQKGDETVVIDAA